MKISTRGRYALRVLIDLAEHDSNGLIALKTVAERQALSLKYIERILPVLTKGGLVDGIQGKGGGCRLAKEPKEIRVGDVLRLTEGDLAPVGCLQFGAAPCPRAQYCKTLPMWRGFQDMINDYFDSITLEDLMKNPAQL